MGSRYQFTDRKRRIIFNLTDGLCWYCGEPAATIDHMQPRSKGGTNKYGNLVPCCDECNQRKADHGVEQYRNQLVNVAMLDMTFGSKAERKVFITTFQFYGEQHNIDPFLPARLATWQGFQDTVELIHTHELSMIVQWMVRISKWTLGRKKYKRLKSWSQEHLQFWSFSEPSKLPANSPNGSSTKNTTS